MTVLEKSATINIIYPRQFSLWDLRGFVAINTTLSKLHWHTHTALSVSIISLASGSTERRLLSTSLACRPDGPSWWSRWWYRIVRQRWRTWNCRGNYFLRESVEAFRINCMSLWRRSVFCFQVEVYVIFDVHLEMIPLIQSSFCAHFFRSEFVCKYLQHFCSNNVHQ